MNTYEKVFLIDLYKTIYTIRIFESRCTQLYRQGLIRGYFHPYLGEEAVAVGVCAALEQKDYIISTHRGHGHCIARGADIKRMVAELFGKLNGYCLGLGGSMHIADLSTGNLGANGIVGGNLPLAVGAGLGTAMRDQDKVTVVFSGDGASNNGVFAESMNLAAIWDLPIIIVIENNQYAVSTPIEDSTRQTKLYQRGQAYGVTSHHIDGNDVLKVYELAQQAISQCRQGKGPVLIEATTYRHGGHHVNDPGSYMPKEKLDYFMEHDPVKIGRKYLTQKAKMSDQEIAAIENTIEEEMEQAITYAEECAEMSLDEFCCMTEGS